MADGDEVRTNGFNKTKIKKAIKDWQTAEDEYNKVCDDAKVEFGAQKDALLESLELIGVKRKVFGTVMLRIKLLTKAEGLRNRLSREDGDALQDQYDAILLAAGLIKEDEAGDEGKSDTPIGADEPAGDADA